ncbi:MAG: hypothetical protein CMN31_24660 [Sandaracinus sp.]|nr:hypothetical protein [Sandaracinus sp.]
MDAGVFEDARVPVDASVPVDADVPVDAGSDAGPSDAGSMDAGRGMLRTLEVRLLGGAPGRVTGADGAIDCRRSGDAICVAELRRDTAVTLTASGVDGSTFTGWSVEGCAEASCELTLEDDLVVTATFEYAPVELTVETSGAGPVTSTPAGIDCAGGPCTASFARGATVVLTATPDADQELAGWTDACAGTAGPVCVLTLDADTTARAAFVGAGASLSVVHAGVGTGTLTSTPAGIDCGSDCAETFELGASVALAASAAAGSVFTGWSGDCAGAGACDLTMDGPRLVVGSFALEMHRVSVARLGPGGGTVFASLGDIDCGAICSDEYAHGTMVTLTAAPDSGSTFEGWGGACAAAGTATTCDLDVTEVRDATATFAKRVYTFDVALGGAGSGVVTSTPGAIDCGATCSDDFEHGTRVTLTATPAASSELVAWGGDCSGSSPTCEVDVNGARSVTAEFGLAPRTLTVMVTGDGDGSVVSMPAGIDCGADCSEVYTHGQTITLQAMVEPGSTFLGWSGAGCSGVGDCVVDMDADHTVTAELRGTPPTVLSDTDKEATGRLREDRLALDIVLEGTARSNNVIEPGSGVFYFEGHRLVDVIGNYGVGVSTALPDPTGMFIGSSDQSFGVNADGSINHDAAYQGGFAAFDQTYYGFVVDYRGATPVVHLVLDDGGAATVHHTQSLTGVTTPLHIVVGGRNLAIAPEMEINPGNDRTNFPFHYDPDAALRAAGLDAVADALVLGWGVEYAGPFNQPPSLVSDADVTVAPGTPVTLTASASDMEDGDLTAAIEWGDLSTTAYDRLTGTGGSFTFTPTEIGLHPIEVRVRDSGGKLVTDRVDVRVDAPIAQHDPVRLEPDTLSGTGIVLDGSGLQANWTAPDKYGIRANQGNYGQFWYFEITRLVDPVNQGGGLVIAGGDLNPYRRTLVPPSFSLNTTGGIWRNIIFLTAFDASATTYGFAVDYTGQHPIVYVIVDDVVVWDMELDDVWVEVFPMLYGNPTGAGAPYDEAINFGATPFAYDPAAALATYGVDTTDFEAGWGDANTGG